MTAHIPRAIMLVASLGAGLASTCSWFQRTVINADPTAPAVTACVEGEARCAGLVPERCERDVRNDGATRWWPLTPRTIDGGVAPCTFRCEINDGGAHCAAPEDAR